MISIHPVPLALHYVVHFTNGWYILHIAGTFCKLLEHFAKCPISHIAHNIASTLYKSHIHVGDDCVC